MILERYLELGRERWPSARAERSRTVHLRATLDWVYRAQDATPDRGVSHSYALGTGWRRSYPETTGYLISTLLNWHATSGDTEARRRAVEMAEWELEVASPEGAIPDLVRDKPKVFDTAQVLFGFLAAWRVFEEARFRAAAERAAVWLISRMQPNGLWSDDPGEEPLTYNARSAWALIEAGQWLTVPEFTQKGLEFLVWTLSREAGHGWFTNNCLNDFEHPLLHTIAYTAQGQLEGGLLTERHDLVAAARRTAEALAGRVAANGRMSGRFDREWTPAVSWACLTGIAQMVIVWRRLDAISGTPTFRESADRALAFLLSVHDTSSSQGGLRGGVRGSFPINGGYLRYAVPNWAAKFQIDALLVSEGSLEYAG